MLSPYDMYYFSISTKCFLNSISHSLNVYYIPGSVLCDTYTYVCYLMLPSVHPMNLVLLLSLLYG